VARATEDEYRQYLRNLGHETVKSTPKKHKYNAKKVEIDGYIFPSKGEGQCYVNLKWQYLGGLITQPLLQVRFALGKHYGRERYFVADFVYICLRSGGLIVADYKGVETEEYKRKRKVFKDIYGFCIKEFKKLDL
jgi:hypothetical protein